MGGSSRSDLEAWLNATSDHYVVTKTLKNTPSEATEVVYLSDDQGNPSRGPFVRKRFDKEAGRGNAYEQLMNAQVQGARLAHQPLLYECNHVGDFLEVVMEFVPGKTLDELVLEEGPGVDLAMRIMPSLCDAVSELHTSFETPIIHRDVKPSNVIVGRDRLALIDLGIARSYTRAAQRDTVRYGTPGYAPPEQFGYGQTSVLSDVYALGMTLAFCLTGEEPTSELREAKFADPRIPKELREVLVRATEFDPVRRHQSAAALRDDLMHASQSHTTPPASSLAKPGIGKVLGTIWNVLLVVLWLLMTAACILCISNPAQNNKEDFPLWFFVLEYVGLLFVPWSLGTYALLYKGWLRSREPFRRWTWHVELPVCLVASVLSMIVVVIIYNLAIA